MLETLFSLTPWVEAVKTSGLPVILYGTGNGADKIKALLDENNIDISSVAVSGGFAHGRQFYGHTTFPIDEAEARFGKCACIVCFGAEGEEVQNIRHCAEIHQVFCPDAPVYGDEWQTKELMIAEKDDIKRVYELLSDDLSRRLFLQNLAFSITGDINYLLPQAGAEDLPEEFFSHGSMHIDIGAFDGDTVISYAEKGGKYSEIVAFEPDKGTYSKLVSNTSGIKDLVCVNAAVSNFVGNAGFDAKHSRGSSLSGFGDCAVTTVDAYTHRKLAFVGGDGVGSIKIDAEGQDMQVIEGAVNTVCECRPCIAVSVYHRGGDIWRIPLYLHRLCGGYKFMIRRKNGLLPAWDTIAIAIKS